MTLTQGSLLYPTVPIFPFALITTGGSFKKYVICEITSEVVWSFTLCIAGRSI